jgi:cbb3-type cytochrome oxidase maturation protein
MTVILYLLVISLALAAGGLAFFLWSLRSGQYDDLDGAASRILFDEEDAAMPKPAAEVISPEPVAAGRPVHAATATPV